MKAGRMKEIQERDGAGEGRGRKEGVMGEREKRNGREGARRQDKRRERQRRVKKEGCKIEERRRRDK